MKITLHEIAGHLAIDLHLTIDLPYCRPLILLCNNIILLMSDHLALIGGQLNCGMTNFSLAV